MDARALLKARKQEARISHPYATYSSNGQLRCVVCGLPVKQASMWEGHLGSKAHRVNVVKMREEEARKRQQQQEEEDDEEDGDGMEAEAEAGLQRSPAAAGKRKADGEVDDVSKRRRLSEEEQEASRKSTPYSNAPGKPGGFPADFFSDPSRAPLSIRADEDEELEEQPAPDSAPKFKTDVELEWERFQAEMIAGSSAQTNEEPDEDRRETYERATVFAEAKLAPQASDGFPGRLGQAEAVVDVPEENEETEEEKRRRIEQDERELIMDRLLEEERTQEEADARVGLLKAKVEALKIAREAKRAAGKKTS